MSAAEPAGSAEGRATDEARSRRLPVGTALLSAAIAVTVLSPLAWLVLRVADIGTARTIDLLLRSSNATVFLNSVALVAVVTVGSVLLGVPLAVLTVRTDLPFKRLWAVVVALPLVIPSYIGAFAYVSAFGPRGTLADVLSPLGIESLPPIYGFGGAALVITLYVYPYVFITTRASLLSFDGTLVEAARTLNHTRWGAFKRVTLPQIAPGVTAGALLAGLYALSDFGTPAIMRFDAFTRVIYVEYSTFAREAAALFSLQLLAVVLVILAIESRVSASERGAHVNRGSGGGHRVRLGRWRFPAVVAPALVAIFALFVPLAVLVMWLLRSGAGGAAGDFAFEWTYGLNSVTVSAAAAGIATLAALPIAYLSARYRSRFATVVERATYVGYAVPGIVLGLSLVYFGVRYLPFLYQTVPLLVFAYVVRFLPQSVGAVRASVLQVDPRLTEAARTLGRTPISSFREVTLPLIAPGIVAGAALVFLTTMKELPATLLLRPLGFETLVTYIWLVEESGYYGQAALPALALLGISALSMLVILSREESRTSVVGGDRGGE